MGNRLYAIMVAAFSVVATSEAFAQGAILATPVPSTSSGMGYLDPTALLNRRDFKLPQTVPDSVCRELGGMDPDWLDGTQKLILEKCRTAQ